MVNTNSGQSVAALFGMERLPMSSSESAEAVFHVVESATKEQSGRFLRYDGTDLPW